MPPPFTYTLWQQWLPFLRGSWTPPIGDDLSDRYVDRTEVRSSEAFPWNATLADTEVRWLAGSSVWQGSMNGMPMQRATADRWRTFTERNTYTGVTQARPVRLPLAGEFWTEHAPNNPDGSPSFDWHAFSVDAATGESWELIGVDGSATQCLSWAHYRRGVLVAGMSSVAAGVSLPPLLLGRNDAPHRLSLYLPNYVGRDGTAPAGTGWPHCGDTYRLSEAALSRHLAGARTPEQLSFLHSLRHYGATIVDRGGHTCWGVQAGAWFDRSTLPALRIRLADLERVTG